MTPNTHCMSCGRRLSDERDEDGVFVFDWMCWECSDAQDRHFEENEQAS